MGDLTHQFVVMDSAEGNLGYKTRRSLRGAAPVLDPIRRYPVSRISDHSHARGEKTTQVCNQLPLSGVNYFFRRVDSSLLLPSAARCLMKNVTHPKERGEWQIEEATERDNETGTD